MKILDLQQGSAAWLAHRRTTRNASDAPAMKGASAYVTRSELVRQLATGLEREVDDETQRRFDRGHEVEPALRALAESIVGEDLFPIIGVSNDGYLGASFDGVSMCGRTLFEAKQSNAEKSQSVERGEIPAADYWQIVQQFAVCDTAQRCLYLVGDGSAEDTARLWINREQVQHDIPSLMAGWRQLDADVAAYQPEPAAAPAPVAARPDSLPSLQIVATGMVTASNLEAWRETALSAIRSANRDLQTDEDFADAEQRVKWCADVESRIETAKAAVLAQTTSIDDVLRQLDDVREEARRVRLDLDKLVKARKEAIKGEIVTAGRNAVVAHYDSINATLGAHAIPVPATVPTDLAAAIKGLRTLTSIRNAVDTAVANLKIAASQRADQVRSAIAAFEAEVGPYEAQFPDRVTLCATKAPEDLRNLMVARIGEYQRKLEAERERIRQQEQERADREARERLEREQREAFFQRHQQDTPKGDDASAAAEPATQPATPATAGTGAAPTPVRTVFGAPSAAPAARIKLGDINAAIAPLSITAEGLSQLGFNAVATERAAKLYAAADLARICRCLSDRLHSAALKQAA